MGQTTLTYHCDYRSSTFRSSNILKTLRCLRCPTTRRKWLPKDNKPGVSFSDTVCPLPGSALISLFPRQQQTPVLEIQLERLRVCSGGGRQLLCEATWCHHELDALTWRGAAGRSRVGMRRQGEVASIWSRSPSPALFNLPIFWLY